MTNKKVSVPAPELSAPSSVFKFTFKIKCIIIAALAFGFYINTVHNQYALDDALLINDNVYVQKGVSGIKHIFTSDAFDSYVKEMHGAVASASSGRWYRPLPMAVFAAEQSLFGNAPGMKHLVNVVFFILCVVAIFYFLSKFLFEKIPLGEDIAFIASLLFVIHPIHTEVVANIKSLDEILSLLFIVCTFIFSLAYCKTRKTWQLTLGLLFFFLAFLSKEYAITLVLLLPLLFYLLITTDIKKVLQLTLPYYGIVALYVLIRISAVGIPHTMPSIDILTNPYLFASASEKIATEFFVLGKYSIILIFPHPLSSDYSFSQIAYHNFGSLKVWLSILLYTGLIAWGILLVVRKNILAFPVFFYLLNVFIISNLLMDFGAIMGERLIFSASLGFIIFPAYGLVQLTKVIPLSISKAGVYAVLGVLLIICGKVVLDRNLQWKNNDTLFATDIYSSPNSFMINSNLGAHYVSAAQQPENKESKNSLIDSAMKYTRRSLVIHKTPYVNSLLNIAIIYYLRNQLDSSKYYCDSLKELYTDYPSLNSFLPLLAKRYLNEGLDVSSKDLRKGINEIKKGLRENSNDADIWYNLGGAYFTSKQFDSARYCWNAALLLKPDYTQAKQGLSALPRQGKDTVKGIR